MPRFWSYISNEEYSAGCTGGTVYLYDKTGKELAKFKDIPYTYHAAFSPKGDILVAKSTGGRLAVYSLEERRLIKKFRFSKIDGCQDDGYCFSPDGEKFYNIERHIESYHSALSVYRTDDFSLEKRLFEESVIEPKEIEYDDQFGRFFALGYFRYDEENKFFVAQLGAERLENVVSISEIEHDFYLGYMRLAREGFTEKSRQWSLGLSYDGYDMESIEEKKHKLSNIWNYYWTKQQGY